MGRLENKVAVITGSGRGLGLTTAALFAREGAQVVVADLDPARAAAVSEQIAVEGGEATAFVADLSYPQGAEEMAAAAIRAYGRIDILINNAALFGAGKRVADMDLGDWDDVMRVNLRGPFLCSKYAIPHMQRQGGGNIVCVSSTSGVLSNEKGADYNTSKHGLIGLVRCIAHDYGYEGIRANAVAPGGMSGTPMMLATPEENLAPYAAQTAFARFARPEEVANAILFLASDEASYITGSVLMVDAGLTAFHPSGRQLEEGRAEFLKNAKQGGSQ